jgi:hypothetical protein
MGSFPPSSGEDIVLRLPHPPASCLRFESGRTGYYSAMAMFVGGRPQLVQLASAPTLVGLAWLAVSDDQAFARLRRRHRNLSCHARRFLARLKR